MKNCSGTAVRSAWRFPIKFRLHGMIMSVITDTPCIAMNNTSGKVKGVYDTIKNDNVKVEFRDL